MQGQAIDCSQVYLEEEVELISLFDKVIVNFHGCLVDQSKNVRLTDVLVIDKSLVLVKTFCL